MEVRYEYRAFGEQLKRLSHSGEEVDDLAKYSYSGKELDDTTNLYYFNARFYDATIGRFINVMFVNINASADIKNNELYADVFGGPGANVNFNKLIGDNLEMNNQLGSLMADIKAGIDSRIKLSAEFKVAYFEHTTSFNIGSHTLIAGVGFFIGAGAGVELAAGGSEKGFGLSGGVGAGLEIFGGVREK